jgi:uncharacterized membrane protein YgcG
MGFAERGESFDFQVSLQGCVRDTQEARLSYGITDHTQVALQTVSKRGSKPSPGALSSNPSEPPKPAAPPKDYSLKEGQTFTIKIPGRDTKKSGSSGSQGAQGSLLGSEGAGGASGGGGLFALPPPPPPGRKR